MLIICSILVAAVMDIKLRQGLKGLGGETLGTEPASFRLYGK